MRANGMRVAAVVTVAFLTGACTSELSQATSPELSVRAGKAPSSPSSITVTALGSLPYSGRFASAPIAMALNNGATRSATRAAGYTMYGTTMEYPFTWTAASGIVPLDVIDEGHSWPAGVSDGGVIVGEFAKSGGPNYAFTVTAGGAMSYLPVPPGTTYSKATGITADGTCISGSIRQSDGWHAVLWRASGIEIVAPGSASGVSNDCRVVSGSSTGVGAVVWRNISGSWEREVLPSAGGANLATSPRYSESEDISPSGEYVVGRRFATDSVTYASVWRFNGTAWTQTDIALDAFAFGVNNSGHIVGVNASGEPTLWRPGSNGYTGKVLPPLERSTQGWAAAINELGQIAGRSRNRSGIQPVIWTVN